MAPYSYDDFVQAIREVLIDVHGDKFRKLGRSAKEIDEASNFNSLALYNKLLKNPACKTIKGAKAELKRFMDVEAYAARIANAQLLPIIKRAEFYVDSDTNAKERFPSQQEVEESLLLRKPFVAGAGLMLGVCIDVAAPNSKVKQLGMVNQSILTRRGKPCPDPFAESFHNLSTIWSDKLKSMSAGPPDSPTHNLRWLTKAPEDARYGHMLKSSFKTEDCTLLLLPEMVRALCRNLQCHPQQLVVTPYQQFMFYAASCSDPLAMTMLGDMTSTLLDTRSSHSWLTNTPITIHDDGLPDDDSTPVTWKPYEYYGSPAGLVDYDGMPSFPVPSNEEAAQLLLEAIGRREAPPLLKMQFTDQCFGCRGTNDLKGCAKCGVAVYCSVECQKKDWRHHKAFCKQQCDTGQKGSGPAPLTQGEAVVTQFKYQL